MTKNEFERFCSSLYASYVNISRKEGREPIGFRLFKSRMRIWEEW